MAITYGELKKRILLQIDEYEADVPEMTTDEDIINRMPDVVNKSVRFVFYGKSHLKTWNVEQGTSINALEPKDADDPKLYGEHRNNSIFYEADDVYEYFFEVDDTAEITITTTDLDGNESVIEITEEMTRNEQPFSEFRPYKGILTTDGRPVHARIEFGGSYFYRYRNVCLHNVAYETLGKVPEYTGFCQHDIPKNLYQITEAYKVENGERKNVAFYTEDNKLYLPQVEGVIYLVSKFFPDPVTDETPDDYVIDIPIEAEWIVVDKASALLTMEGDYNEFLADEEQGMQMMEAESDRGKSRVAKIVRLL